MIGLRLKQSGMFRTVRGANAIIALRCTRLRGKFEDYWASRPQAACIAHILLARPGGPGALDLAIFLRYQ